MSNLGAEVVLEWGDGQYLFSLKGKQIEELETLQKAGIGEIFQRIERGTWFWGDLYQTVRLGLIGGGMGAVEAKRLTDMYANRPLVEGPNSPLTVASAVIGAALFGLDKLSPGEPQAGVSPAKEAS